MGYICIALFFMFVYFGYLNFNDPDPVHWVAIYFAAATVCLLAYFKMAWWYVDAPLILIYVIYSIVNWPNTFKGFRMPMNDHDMNIEKGRESVGLLIAAACTVFSYWVGKGGWIF
ncbi:MAG: transmembrane 220 family protein [Bacteroidetes bacterium]|nr:transmembrane 220 family protein [Bacteroidota bacterium]